MPTSIEVREALQRIAPNKIFGIEFVKRDGSIRKMSARLNVKQGITGKGHPFNDDEKNIITVCDVAAVKRDGYGKGYRCIKCETIRRITVDGETYLSSEPIK